MIRHTVVFSLPYAPGSDEERAFLEAADVLRTIPTVVTFTKSREISDKNPYQLHFAFEFTNDGAYRAYTDHPAHAAFVRDRWNAEVIDFLEIDTVPLA